MSGWKRVAVLGVFRIRRLQRGPRSFAWRSRYSVHGRRDRSCDSRATNLAKRLLHLLQENRVAGHLLCRIKILAVAAEFCANHWHDDATLLVLAVDEQ
jgi:hypothetical protein